MSETKVTEEGGEGCDPGYSCQELEVDGSTVRIRRDSDTGSQNVESSLPAVVSVTDQTGEARYPSFKGIMAAKKKPVQTWSLDDLGVSAEDVGLSAAWTSVAEVAARPPRSHGEVVTDPAEIRPALDRAAASGLPSLVEVHIAETRRMSSNYAQ